MSAEPADPIGSGSPDARERVGFAHPYSAYVMGVLFLVYVVSYIDRQVMAVLIDPIKADIGVSDTLMGILVGVSFALFYATLGMPIARYADRESTKRRNIIALGVAFWSVMTALTGLARGFVMLAVARVGVGAGEAAGGAPGHSIISDYFPPRQRATALALYTTGGTVGIALGLMLGGILGDALGWRMTFIVLGLPGVAIALLVWWTVREPPRGRFDSGPTPPDVPMATALRHLWSRPAYVWLTLAAALHVFAGYGAGTWHPSFLRRIHDMSGQEVGMWLGPVHMITSVTGNILWARLADILGRRDVRWYMWLPMAGSLAAMPFAYAFVLIPHKLTALLFLFPASLLGSSYLGATYAMAQGLAKPNMRTVAAASLLFVINMIGMGLGPTLVGIMNDVLVPRFGVEAIRISLLIIGLPHVVASLFNYLASRTLREDLRRVQEE